MTLSNVSLPDLIGLTIGFLLTIFVFSYLIGDNPFFRLALHIFIGVAAGFAAIVTLYNVVWNQFLGAIYKTPGSAVYMLVPPVLLGLWLLVKLSPRLAWLGNPVMAYLVGAGAATAIGGATLGTIFPQIGASTGLFNLASLQLGPLNSLVALLRGAVILVGTITTLLYFHFGVRSIPGQDPKRPAWIEKLGWVGLVFIAITFGSLFAGVYSAALTSLIERLRSILSYLFLFIPTG